MSLWAQFQDLPSSSERESEPLTGIEIVHGGDHYVFKDPDGRPCTLFRLASSSGEGERVLAIALQHLRMEPRLHCRVRNGADHVEGDYGLLRCLSASEELQEYLLKILEKVLDGRAGPITPLSLNALILRLVELFESVEATPRGTVAGLWAELFVALRAQSPLDALKAWHRYPEDRYDFAQDLQRVEVKCSTSRQREHHFSFEQAYPQAAQKVVVASLYAQSSRAGVSLGELWDRARETAAADSDLVLSLERNCLRILGKGWSGARRACFDPTVAEDSVAFYAMESIPRLAAPLPPGVIRAEFVADLGGCTPLSREALGVEGIVGSMLGGSW